MPDPDPHPPVIRPEQRVDRTQSVMAGVSAASLHPQLSGSQIDLVMNDDDFRRRNLEEPRCFNYRLARSIHKGLRFQEEPALAVDRTLCELALETVAKTRETVAPCNRLDCHEADIVPVP